MKTYIPLIFTEVSAKTNGNGNGIFNNGGPNIHYTYFKTNGSAFTVSIITYNLQKPIWLWRSSAGYKVATFIK